LQNSTAAAVHHLSLFQVPLGILAMRPRTRRSITGRLASRGVRASKQRLVEMLNPVLPLTFATRLRNR